jgi:hypothetical protein
MVSLGTYRKAWEGNIKMDLIEMYWEYVGRDSSLGIATRYGLDGSGDRIPLEARFFAPVQIGPRTHSTSYTTDTGCLSRR